MKCRFPLLTLIVLCVFSPLLPSGAAGSETAIICPADAPALHRFAAREVRR